MPLEPEHQQSERVAALRALDVLGTEAEDRFDRITRMASQLLGMPMSMLSLVDHDRQWNKSTFGLELPEQPLSQSLCNFVVRADAPLVVPDLQADPAYADMSFGLPGLRSYAGWPLHDGAGHAVGVLCVLDDQPRHLTDEQRELMRSLSQWAQAELNAQVLRQALTDVRSNESRLLALLDDAPAAVLLVARTGIVDWVNTPARRLLAAEGLVLEGRMVRSLLPQIELAELEGQGRRRTDREGPGRRFVQPGRRADGSTFPAELTVSMTGGSRSQYIVFLRDLAEEHESAAELAELRQRTEVAFDALAEGVLVAEADGRISWGNLAAAQMLRRRRTDLPGCRWHDVLHQVPAADEPCALVDPLALVGRTISPVDVRRADGSHLPAELSVRMLSGAGGAPGVVVTLHDLTDRLRNERLKNELISAVSHELRTPLTSIRGSLSLLRAKAVDPASEQGARMIEIATTSSERLSRLVNDILDLERLQAGRLRLDLGRQRASALMLAAAQAVSGAAVAAQVRVDVVDSDERVIADTDRVVQILVNLLGNAIKFSPAGSTVVMSAAQDGDLVRLSVADRGRGIPSAELDRIFDRFAQVDGSDSREFEGTGLGLAIARGLAEQHGGELSATSAVGEGSTFVLSLPVAALRHRLLAYCPADQVPDALAQLMAQRGWETRAVGVDGLAASHAGAVLLNSEDPAVVDEVRREATRLQLPLLTLSAVAGRDRLVADRGPDTSAREDARGSVLLVEDDDDLAEILRDALSSSGLEVARVADEAAAVHAVRQRRPAVVVLDLRLAGGDGFGVVDALREHGLPPVLVYSVLELDDGERVRLQAGGTSFLTKGRHPVEDVVHEVVRLVRTARPDEQRTEEQP